MNRMMGMAAAAAVGCIAGVAMGDNPLVISGMLSPTDLVAIGFDGPNAPGASTFYYDMYLIGVDTPGVYTFAMEAPGAGLAPWVGVYGMNFNAMDYFGPAPLDLVAGPAGGVVSMDIVLSPGLYQVVASSVDWIEEPDALDEGAYSVTVAGPEGATVRLVPAPGVGLALVGGLAMARRRRR